MILVCLECGSDMLEVKADFHQCPSCGYTAEQITLERWIPKVRQLTTHDECMAMLEDINQSPDGDWTHELTEIATGPARFVERLILPSGLEVVYFRAPGQAKAWPANNWDRFAVCKVPERVEQLTLF